jgi:glutamate:GABA antiporter
LQKYSHQPAYFVTFSVVVLVLLTVLNIFGLDLAKCAHNLGAIANVGSRPHHYCSRFRRLASLSALPIPLHPTRSYLRTGSRTLLFWSVIIFSFIGCETASVMAGEIKDARRNIPRALLLAGVTVVLCYMLGTFCALLAVPSAESTDLDGLSGHRTHVLPPAHWRTHLFRRTVDCSQ